jgi:hypothetical protein
MPLECQGLSRFISTNLLPYHKDQTSRHKNRPMIEYYLRLNTMPWKRMDCNLKTGRRFVISSKLRPLYTPGNIMRFALNWRIGGSQNSSECGDEEKNPCPQPWIEPPIPVVQPVAELFRLILLYLHIFNTILRVVMKDWGVLACSYFKCISWDFTLRLLM